MINLPCIFWLTLSVIETSSMFAKRPTVSCSLLQLPKMTGFPVACMTLARLLCVDFPTSFTEQPGPHGPWPNTQPVITVTWACKEKRDLLRMWYFRGLNIQQETGITQNVIDHYVVWTCDKKQQLLRIWSTITWWEHTFRNSNYSECDHCVI